MPLWTSRCEGSWGNTVVTACRQVKKVRYGQDTKATTRFKNEAWKAPRTNGPS